MSRLFLCENNYSSIHKRRLSIIANGAVMRIENVEKILSFYTVLFYVKHQAFQVFSFGMIYIHGMIGGLVKLM